MKTYKNITVIFIFATFCSAADWSAFFPGKQTETDEKNMKHAKEKELLLLTDINEADYNTKGAERPEFEDLKGIGDFAIISGIPGSQSSRADPERLSLNVCSSDFTVFRVYISKPKSLPEACTLIIRRFGNLGFSNALLQTISNYAKPKLEGERYTVLLDTSSYIGLTHLSIERGILIEVEFRRQSALQTKHSPVNREIVLDKMSALVDDLIAFVDGDRKMSDEKLEYYKKIRAAYSGASYRVDDKNSNASRFDLVLLESTSGNDIDGERFTKATKIIATEPYILSRADGEPIPTVKMYEPANATADIMINIEAVEDLKPADIQVIGAEAWLRNDGRYQVVFHPKSGKRTVELLYIDKEGKVYEAGSITVEVEEHPEQRANDAKLRK